MTETSWHDLIDSSIDAGPEPRLTAADAAAAGRRALRRRRGNVAAMVGTSALVIGLAVPFAASTLGDGGGSLATHNAHQATPPVDDHVSPRVTTIRAATGPALQTSAGPVRFDAASGTITPPPGWDVVEQRDGVAGPGSTAMSITNGSQTYYIVYFAPGSLPVAIIGFPDGVPFGQWLDALEPNLRQMQTGQAGE